MTEPAAASWHQTLPAWLAVIITIVVQTVVMAVWLGSLRSDLDAAMTTNARQDGDIVAVQADAQRMQVGAATVNAQLQGLRESLIELKEAQRETNQLLRQFSAGQP